MARGFKIADAYVEIVADRDVLKDSVREIPAAVGAEADRAGKEIGDRLTRGLARSVEQLSVQVEKARRREVEAFGAVHLAQLRLNEARDKGTASGSKLLALEQKLTKAKYEQQAATGALAGATNKLTDAQRQLSVQMENVGRNAGPAAGRAGDDIGSKLSQGIRMSVVRNSPLIAAAIAGALAAGAPLMTAAAVTLMAGIGIVAAAQSQEVQSAWKGTWQSIKAGAIADARPIEDTLIGLAGRVGASFERLRPSLRDAFVAVAPHIDVIADSMLRAAESAVPALTRSLQGAGPVVEGLASFIESTGTGFAKFFDILTAHSPAAGRAFSALGQIVGTLLPILGELLGQGAELAAVVLPPLASILGVVADALSRLGPLLPAVAAGFLGLKVAHGVGGMIEGLATRIGAMAASGGTFAGVAGKMTGGLGALKAAAGPAGAAVGFTVAALIAWTEAGKRAAEVSVALGRAFEVGGSQANAATGYIEKFNWINGALETGVGRAIGNISILGFSFSDMIPDVTESRDAYNDWVAGLDPVARTAEAVRVAQERLKTEIRDHGPASSEAAVAAQEFADAERDAARAANEEEDAIRGVTDAMLAQTEAIYNRADADLNLRNSIDSQEDAFIALNEAIRDHGAASEESSDAGRRWEGTLNDQVSAARRLAEEALPAAMDANQKKALSDLAALDALRQLEAQYGDKLPPAIRAQIPALEEATASYDRGKLQAAAFSAGLDELGNKRPMPVANMNADPFTGVAQYALDVARSLHGQRPTPTANMDGGPFSAVANWMGGVLGWLGGQQPTPSAHLNGGPFSAGANWMGGVLGWLHNWRPSPVATLHANTGTAEAQLNYAARSRTAFITAVTAVRGLFPGLALGGKVGDAVRGFADGGSPSRSADGKLTGPGGPLDDLIPAISDTGEKLRVANREWIINALQSDRYGDRKMAGVNSGIAQILMPGDPGYVRPGAPPAPRRFADGGSPASRSVTTAPGRTVTVEHVSIHIDGTFDLASSADLRKAAQKIRDLLIELEREQS